MSVELQERVSSTHKVEVVPVKLERHPNADKLSIIPVFGYQCVGATADWAGVPLAAYVVPDSVVDTSRSEFSFLAPRAKEDGTYRVRAMRLRGAWSQGLLVPAPAGSREGDDVAALLGVERYEPPQPGSPHGPSLITGGECAPAPSGTYPKYDLESWQRYKHLLVTGEEVIITEKLHGANSRYVYQDGRMHCGSRTEWKKEYPSYDHLNVEAIARGLLKRVTKMIPEHLTEEDALRQAREILDRVKSKTVQKNLWWRVLDAFPEIRAWCEARPGWCLYGEVFGQVQDLKYGTSTGQVLFRAFDVWDGARFLDANMLEPNALGIPTVPVLYRGPYSDAQVRQCTDGPSVIPAAGHLREGCVVKPAAERWSHACGRVALKSISNFYLEKSGN